MALCRTCVSISHAIPYHYVLSIEALTADVLVEVSRISVAADGRTAVINLVIMVTQGPYIGDSPVSGARKVCPIITRAGHHLVAPATNLVAHAPPLSHREDGPFAC